MEIVRNTSQTPIINYILQPPLKKVRMIFHRWFIAIFKMYDVLNLAFSRNCLCRINFMDKTSIQTTPISVLIDSLKNSNLSIITCKFWRNLLFPLRSLLSSTYSFSPIKQSIIAIDPWIRGKPIHFESREAKKLHPTSPEDVPYNPLITR